MNLRSRSSFSGCCVAESSSYPIRMYQANSKAMNGKLNSNSIRYFTKNTPRNKLAAMAWKTAEASRFSSLYDWNERRYCAATALSPMVRNSANRFTAIKNAPPNQYPSIRLEGGKAPGAAINHPMQRRIGLLIDSETTSK